MSSLNQFAWVAGTAIYRFGHNSIPNIPIVGAPDDADLSNWAMLHDGSAYRLYAFKRGTTDTLYQAAFNGSAYQFGFNSIPVLRLVGFPADADASSFAMLHDGSAYRLYLRRSGDPRTLYQASWVAGTDTYQFGHNSIPAIPVVDCGAGVLVIDDAPIECAVTSPDRPKPGKVTVKFEPTGGKYTMSVAGI